MAVYDERNAHHVAAVPLAQRAGRVVNYAGAAVSLALVVGVGVWGYKLVMRDVSGIPVVRAMEGDMRVAPQTPGGEVALHTGLAVNAVAAVGEAAPPEDTLVLAPATTGLAEEDLRAQPLAESQEVLPIPEVVEDIEVAASIAPAETAPTGPLSTTDILALADQIAGTAQPLTELAEGVDVAPQVLLDGEEVTADTETVAEPVATVETASAAAPTVSRRPSSRPAALQPAAAATSDAQTDAAVTAALEAAMAPVATASAAVVETEFAAGTNLVQLGAFPSPEVAATEWDRLMGRFGDFMTDKTRVIQEATSGGRTFYRLRASGFAELGDARRFCAELGAQNADCIPVVVR